MNLKPDEWYALSEVARICNKSYSAIYAWVTVGLAMGQYGRVYLKGRWNGGTYEVQGKQVLSFLELRNANN